MRRYAAALVVPLGVLLLVDVLRVWLPSIITIFGRAAETPAELLGAFALLWFLLGFLAPPLGRLLGTRRLALAGALVLAACRAALGFTAGGPAQLYVACAGLLAGLCWLAALAMDAVPSLGVVLGLCAATVQHAALGTLDLTWRPGAPAGLLLALEAVAFAAAAALTAGTRPPEPSTVDATGTADGSARGWFLVGPAILLWGMFAGSPAVAGTAVSYLHPPYPGPVATTPGVGGVLTQVLLVAVAALAPAAAAAVPAMPTAVRLLAALGLVVAAALFTLAPPATLGLAVLLGAPALGACLGTDFTVQGGPSGHRREGAARRGFALVAGALLMAVCAVLYYASYDLGYRNAWVPPLLGAVVAGVVASAPRRRPGWRRPALVAPRRRGRWAVVVAAGVVATLALAAIGARWSVPRQHPVSGATTLRLVTYNIRMGFGLDGRLDLPGLAGAIGGQHPDVVLLQEVDRGWFLNGGHDDLGLLAGRLGLHYVFAPAADAVWGDAVLTNVPVLSARTVALPAVGAPTGAQALAVVLDLGGTHLGLVVTHLQPPPDEPPTVQARAVARFAGPLAAAGPVVIAGDLNAEPGSPAFAALTGAGFTDALAAARPLPTDPSDRPRQQIDHILVTNGVTARDIVAPRTTASDHLPVAATLTIA